MRLSTLIFILITLFTFTSCTKENSVTNSEGKVKTIVSETDMAAVASFTDNENNLIIVGRNLNNNVPGMFVKLDPNGNEIGRKTISTDNKVLWSVTGTRYGFLTVGYELDAQRFFTVCKYDFEGKLISTKNISISNEAGYYSPGNIIQLSNSNYAVICSDNTSYVGYIYILNQNLHVISNKILVSPIIDFRTCFLYGIQQLNDSIIAITASSTMINGWPCYANSMLFRTDLSGNKISVNLLLDPDQSETTNCLAKNNNSLLSVTAGMTGWNNGEGCFVNYLNNPNAQFICGRINLIRYDFDGNFVERKKIFSYPGNGMINSTHQTRDGGFILCGTVNLSNSSIVNSDSRIYLLKLDANYNEQWSKVIDTVYPSLGTEAFETVDGGYWLTGYQRSNNSKFNMIVIKTDRGGDF